MPATPQQIHQLQLNQLPSYLEWCEDNEKPKSMIQNISKIDIHRGINYAMLKVLNIYDWIRPLYTDDDLIFSKVNKDCFNKLPQKIKIAISTLKQEYPNNWHAKGYRVLDTWYNTFNPSDSDRNAIISLAIMFNWLRPKEWKSLACANIDKYHLKVHISTYELALFTITVKGRLFYHRVSPNHGIEVLFPTKIDTGLQNLEFGEDYGTWKIIETDK